MEALKVISEVEPEHVKLGNHYWQAKLRDYEPEEQKMEKEEFKQKFETIRKPNSAVLKSRESQNALIPYKSFTSQVYMSQKLGKYEQRINSLLHVNEGEIGALEIKGQNKFQEEAACLQNQLRQNPATLFKVPEPSTENQDICPYAEKYIVSNWNKKVVTSKGQIAFKKF